MEAGAVGSFKSVEAVSLQEGQPGFTANQYLLVMACIASTAVVLALIAAAVLAVLFAVEGISYHLPDKTSGATGSGTQGEEPK